MKLGIHINLLCVIKDVLGRFPEHIVHKGVILIPNHLLYNLDWVLVDYGFFCCKTELMRIVLFVLIRPDKSAKLPVLGIFKQNSWRTHVLAFVYVG